MNFSFLFKFLIPLVYAYGLKLLVSAVKRGDYDDYPEDEETVLELYLPFRLDFLAEMKLTTIFPRKFMYTLKDYEKSKKAGVPIISMPNYSSGLINLGVLRIPNKTVLVEFFNLMDDLTKRVFRTGLNDQTISGNFRLALNGLGIEEDTGHVFASIDAKYPTDSYSRYLTFMKSLYYRLSKMNLTYEMYGDFNLDQLVLGRVEDIKDINMKAFDEMFGRFMVGFVTFSKISILTPQTPHEKLKSYFYFDHVSHEPIIGVENTVEGDGFEGGVDGKGTGKKKQDGESKLKRPDVIKRPFNPAELRRPQDQKKMVKSKPKKD